MKRLPALLLVVCLLTCFESAFPTDSDFQKLSPRLNQIVNSPLYSISDSLVDVLVIMENDEVQSEIAKSAPIQISRASRIKTVTAELRSFRPDGYDRVREYLTSVSTFEPTSYWIIPAFSARIPAKSIRVLEEIPGVKLVVENASLVYDEPVEIAPAPSLSTAVSTHLQMLNVPSLWQRGLTGRGRLICSFDTGVDVGHPALAGKWKGHSSTLSSSWFSMVEPDSLPNDNVGHGTHTMGIMVGSEGADTIGVAFDANWISAGVIDQGRPLSSTITDILSAFQWVLNPDGNFNTTDDVPDVILNSWGVPRGLFAPCDATFWTVIDNVEAAGIVTIFAAGNEGPGAKTMRSPADRASSSLNSFAVGGVDNAKVIGSFSSRGPSSCDTSQHKPEVVAPSVMVRSSIKGGGYGYMTGTSMAAPFIAGMVALIREFNPDATVAQIKNAILLSCEDLGPFGDDNSYGHGLPDASKVLDFVPPPSNAVFSISQSAITDNITPFPGDSFHLRITLTKQSGSVNNIIGSLKCLNPGAAELLVDRAGFFFGGTAYSALSVPEFQVRFDSALYHGQNVDFVIELEDGTGNVFDSLYFSLAAGLAPNGAIAVLPTGRIDFSVSDFGQYGFGPGSIYNAGGQGFRIDG
ncbi:MAG TPA: S8 family serine peptidase, partial [candidate division Zixibacteria bacterium]|nr:S8 family serine peptidase [candidate division Zixibacteria bacterium]